MVNKPTTQQLVIIVIIALAVVLFVFGQRWLTLLSSQGGDSSFMPGGADMNPRTLPSGLAVEDVVIGTGAEAIVGAILSVHYVGTLVDGTKFDSSRDRGTPFQFMLGVGQVIRGWDEGFAGMKVGGVRKLIIPPQLAYGSVAGHPLQNEILVFEVELLAV